MALWQLPEWSQAVVRQHLGIPAMWVFLVTDNFLTRKRASTDAVFVVRFAFVHVNQVYTKARHIFDNGHCENISATVSLQ